MTERPEAGEGRERDHEGGEAGGRGPVLSPRNTRERSRRSGLSHRGRGEAGGRERGERRRGSEGRAFRPRQETKRDPDHENI